MPVPRVSTVVLVAILEIQHLNVHARLDFLAADVKSKVKVLNSLSS